MENLNPIQLEAVKTTEGYLRVIAGAGSGKTKMLVSRYVYIIKELGINANNVICLTFSNKTANEMKKRIKELLGTEDQSFVTTYHGLGARIIGENAYRLFFPKGFEIIARDRQKDILGDIYEELEIKLDSATFESIIEKIEIFKSDLNYIKYIVDTSTTNVVFEAKDLTEEIIKKYLTVQKKHFLIDFSDLINFAIYLLENYEEVRTKWQKQLNYVLVDEFQDSTEKEVRLINLISGHYKNVMVVGDPDQNIYEWRGAKMEYLVHFDKEHKKTQTIVMNQNYRSTDKILNCANSLIKHNKMRYPKDLYTNNPEGESVLYFEGASDYKEAEWICDTIKKLHNKEKELYNSFAVLYRASYLSRVLEQKMNELGIPYEIIGGIKFFQRLEIKDIIAYMRLCCYDDDYALKRIINVPKRQFGKIKLDTLQRLKEEDKSLYHTLKENKEIFKNKKIEEFIEIIEYIRDNITTMTISDIYDYLLDKTGYQKYIREMGNEERLNNLGEMQRVIQGMLTEDKNLTLVEALTYFSLQSDHEMESGDKVKLMTIHAAKGLEFDNVFVIGLNEGTFPSKKTIETRDQSGLEEERRLCYVALTRARKRLFLTSVLGFSRDDSSKIPSRFLKEIGENNYFSINPKKNNNSVGKSKYVVGDKVTHKVFGTGKIIDIDYKHKSYAILFDKSKELRNVDFSYDFEGKTKSNNQVTGQIPSKETRDFNIFTKEEQKVLDKLYQEKKKSKALEKKTIENEDQIYDTIEDDYDIIEPVTIMFDENIEIDLKELETKEITNLWEDSRIPKKGWRCIGITDLGYPSGSCMMCNQDGVRYLHHMKHKKTSQILSVGCVCAGKMEGDNNQAASREKNFKNKVSRKMNFLKKTWKKSRNGSLYLNYQKHILVIYETNNKQYVVYVDNKRIERIYNTKEELLNDVFEIVDNKSS